MSGRVLLLCCVLITKLLFSQSIYVQGNDNATGVGLSALSSEGKFIPTITLAHSHRGFLDLAISVGKISDAAFYYGAHQYQVILSPVLIQYSIGLYKRPDQQDNFGMGLVMALQTASTSGNDTYGNQEIVDYSSRSFTIALEPYWPVPNADPNTKVFISLSPSVCYSAYEIGHPPYGYAPPDDGPDILLGVSALCGIHVNANDPVSISIEFGGNSSYSINQQDSFSSFGVGVGLLYHLSQ